MILIGFIVAMLSVLLVSAIFVLKVVAGVWVVRRIWRISKPAPPPPLPRPLPAYDDALLDLARERARVRERLRAEDEVLSRMRSRLRRSNTAIQRDYPQD
jgi:hypothetical protein